MQNPQDLMIQPTQQQQIFEQPPQHPQQPMMPNPFDSGQYRNLRMPDIPINFGGSIADALLNDNEVPEEIRKRYWFVFHKDNVLTFLDEARHRNKLMNFDITKIDILNSIPYTDYDFNLELHFGLLRNVLETKLDRALGLKGKNERLTLQTQFQEQRQISEDGNRDAIKQGFFKRLMGRR